MSFIMANALDNGHHNREHQRLAVAVLLVHLVGAITKGVHHPGICGLTCK